MGTRTAIFQEQTNGEFLGIYVHYDGYIEGVGKTLFEHYKSRDKTYELLDKKLALSSLGQTTMILNEKDYRELHRTNPEETIKYCSGGHISESFLAGSLDEIRRLDYLVYSEGQIDGFYVKDENGEDEFVPYRGSDNNGFLYYQDLKGEWFVSQMEDKAPYNMKEFEKL
ncbi:hypothetical protein ACFYSI_13200 [Staphylococcus xylosus]|uniref:hypothetical protein n=1 Tax=Staphylococcus xylosus TaxID=1288 RepID=UPI00368DB9D2